MISTITTFIAPEILRCLHGEKPLAVREIVGKGEANRVFDVTLPQRSVIIKMQRFADALATYKKEAWCTNQAIAHGIPSPNVIGYGAIAASEQTEFRSFLILEKLEGIHGADTSASDQLFIWRKLGTYARQIHQIKTSGFGFGLIDEATGTFQTPTWKDTIASLREEYLSNEHLTNGKTLSHQLFSKALELIAQLENWEVTPALSHSNLVPKNAVFSPQKEVYLIDWGTAFSGPAVLQEVAELSTWDFAQEAIQHFIEGYGISVEAFSQLQEQARPLIVLRTIDTIGWAAHHVPQWQEKSYVTHSLKKLKSLL